MAEQLPADAKRQTADTFSQPPACGDEASRPKASHQDLIERLARVEKGMSEQRVWSDSLDARLQLLESCHRQHAASDHDKIQETSNLDPPDQEGSRSCQEAFTEDISQKELQEKTEYEKLKEKIKELEARNRELFSEVMSMHEKDDPSGLSAVLEMYDKLRLQEWKIFRASKNPRWKYKDASSLIRCLFNFCEKEVQQRIGTILEVLELPPSKHATIKDDQEIMEEIRKILKYSYYQNDSKFYFRMAAKAGVTKDCFLFRGKTAPFVEQCCKIYCLLLLQDPPVKAEWKLPENSMQDLEHVERKGREFWTEISLFWPIMKCGEHVIVKGVVWDEYL